MKIAKIVAQFLFGGSKKQKPLTPEKKKEIALDYINQLKQRYDVIAKCVTGKAGEKIGANMNSLQLMAIEASILTNQTIVSDELLIELERVIFMEV